MVKFSSSRNKKSMKKRNLLIAILIVAMLAFSVAGTCDIYVFFQWQKSNRIKTNATSQSNKSNNNSAIDNHY